MTSDSGPASVLPPPHLPMPADTPEYMRPAWIGCLHWALGNDEIIAAFRAETGNRWTPGRTGIDRMIDEATGADRKFFEDFVAWFNCSIWGPMDDPAGAQESERG